jgi:hypothetical protein
MAAATKKKRKEEAYPWKAGASSRHITNLKQSILETFDIYGSSMYNAVAGTYKITIDIVLPNKQRTYSQHFLFFETYKWVQ